MDRIYQYQQYGYSFTSVERLLHAMGGDDFLTLMNQTLEETMRSEGFSQVFINEIVAPITRVNYGQSVRIDAFVGKSLDHIVIGMSIDRIFISSDLFNAVNHSDSSLISL